MKVRIRIELGSESSHAIVQGMKRSTMALKLRTDVKQSPNKHIINLRNERIAAVHGTGRKIERNS